VVHVCRCGTTANCRWNPIKRCVENDATLNDLEEDNPLVKRYHVTLDPEARKRLGVVDLAEAFPSPGGDTATVYMASIVHTMREQKGTKNRQVNSDVDSISTYLSKNLQKISTFKKYSLAYSKILWFSVLFHGRELDHDTTQNNRFSDNSSRRLLQQSSCGQQQDNGAQFKPKSRENGWVLGPKRQNAPCGC
jgi:hypothetical protein